MTETMTSRLSLPLTVLGLAAALALSGCGGPAVDAPAAPDAPGQSDASTNGENDPAPQQESMVDPAWPWPGDVPKPSGVFYEFSAKNPLGEGGLWQVDFRASGVAEAQALVDSLLSSGWEGFLGQAEPLEEPDGSISWVLSHGDRMGTISSEDTKASPIVFSFVLMGPATP